MCVYAFGAEYTSVSVLKVLRWYASACLLPSVSTVWHRLGQRVKLCDTGRCQVMTKLCRSGRSDVLREREEVMVVVVSPEIKLGNGCPGIHNFTFSTIIDKVAPSYH